MQDWLMFNNHAKKERNFCVGKLINFDELDVWIIENNPNVTYRQRSRP